MTNSVHAAAPEQQGFFNLLKSWKKCCVCNTMLWSLLNSSDKSFSV